MRQAIIMVLYGNRNTVDLYVTELFKLIEQLLCVCSSL
jgi:hypothetical protein